MSDIVTELSKSLKLDSWYLTNIINRSYFYYKDYTISKANGKKRHIAQPSPELKTLQYWLVKNVFSHFPISDVAKAYNHGDSILKNAEVHQSARHILHIDIDSFFPSIHSSHLINVFSRNKDIWSKLGFDQQSQKVICNICFRDDSLCIGAVSSPIISNIIMYGFDVALKEYCQVNHYNYTRYADDIFISSKHYIPQNVLSLIQREILKLGFTLNQKKTRFYSPKGQRRVTGITITDNGELSIGLANRKKIKRMIYQQLVHGTENPSVVLGHLAFLKSIEPNTHDNYIIKYSQYCSGDMLDAIKKHSSQ